MMPPLIKKYKHSDIDLSAAEIFKYVTAAEKCAAAENPPRKIAAGNNPAVEK